MISSGCAATGVWHPPECAGGPRRPALTLEQCERISVMWNAGVDTRTIADAVGREPAAIRHYATTRRRTHGDVAFRRPRRKRPSLPRPAEFDAYAQIAMISPRPLLMIAVTDADTRYFSEEAIAKAAELKQLALIDGATHISLYDRESTSRPPSRRCRRSSTSTSPPDLGRAATRRAARELGETGSRWPSWRVRHEQSVRLSDTLTPRLTVRSGRDTSGHGSRLVSKLYR